jgi:hypothetical protein
LSGSVITTGSAIAYQSITGSLAISSSLIVKGKVSVTGSMFSDTYVGTGPYAGIGPALDGGYSSISDIYALTAGKVPAFPFMFDNSDRGGYSTVGGVKYVYTDIGIGYPGLDDGYNLLSPVIYFSRDQFSAIDRPKYLTIISDNTSVSMNTVNAGIYTKNGRNHVLTVTGSFLSLDGVSLGSDIANKHYITGSVNATGSWKITGSVNVSTGVTASLFGTSSWARNSITSSYPISVTGSTLYSTSPRSGPDYQTDASSSVQSLFFGTDAGKNAGSASYAIAIGFEAASGNDNIDSSVVIGRYAGRSTSVDTTSNNTVFIGYQAGFQAYNSDRAVFIGNSAGDTTYTSSYSVFLGYLAGPLAYYAHHSNFIGGISGYAAVSASYSNFMGWRAGQAAHSASYSILIGLHAGRNNVGLGYGIGSNNIVIGNNVTLPDNASNAINIGGIIFGSGSYFSNELDLSPSSSPSNGKIGINVTKPSSSLDVSGSVAFRNLQTSSIVPHVVLYNTASGQLFYTSSATITSPGGTNQMLQYNNNGVLAGTSIAIFDGDNLIATGSFTGSFTGLTKGQAYVSGGLYGTSSYSTTSSYATTASYAITASYAMSSSFSVSSSYSLSSSLTVSSSFSSTSSLALSSSYVNITGSGSITITYFGNQIQISGSTTSVAAGGSDQQLQYNSNGTINGTSGITTNGTVVAATGSFTGSFSGRLSGTSSWSSNSVTASYVTGSIFTVNNPALSASYASASSYSVSSSYAISSSNSISSSYSFSGSYAITASYALNGGTAATVVTAGPGVTVTNTFSNQYQVSANVRTVNNISPVDGNIATSLTATRTGNSQSLVNVSSGAVTASIADGTVWVISGDANANNNGDVYIYVSSSVGQWYPISPLDVAAADARYLMLTPQAALSASLTISGSLNVLTRVSASSFTGSILGTATSASYVTGSIFSAGNLALSSSFAVTASYALNGGGTSNLDTSSVIITGSATTRQSITGSLIISGSLKISGSTSISGSLIVTNGVTASLFGTSSWADKSNYPFKVTGSNNLVSIHGGDFESTYGIEVEGFIDNIVIGNNPKFYPIQTNNYVRDYISIGNNAMTGSGPNVDTDGNIAIGTEASSLRLGQTLGTATTHIGKRAGYKTGNAPASVFIGYSAGAQMLADDGGTNTVAIGYAAGSGSSAKYSTLIGTGAGRDSYNLESSIMIGISAGQGYLGSPTGFGPTGSILIGREVGYTTTDWVNGSNISIGYQSLYRSRTNSNNIILGYQAVYEVDNLRNSIAVGYRSLYRTTGSANIIGLGYQAASYAINANSSSFIGDFSGYLAKSVTSSIFIGTNSGYASELMTGSIVIGDRAAEQSKTGSFSVFIGNRAGYKSTASLENIFIGPDAGYLTDTNQNSTAIRGNSIFIGNSAGANSKKIYKAVVIGQDAGKNSNNAYNSIAIGNTAAYGTGEGQYSIMIGNSAGLNNATASSAIAIGADTSTNVVTSSNSIAIGTSAGYMSYFIPANGFNATSVNSIKIGSSAGADSYNANDSIMIGRGAGSTILQEYPQNNSGSIFIGTNSGFGSLNASQSIYIGNNVGNSNNSPYSIIIGNLSGRGLAYGKNNIIIGNAIALPPLAKNCINIGGILFGSGSYFSDDINSVISTPVGNGLIGINTFSPTHNLDVSGSGDRVMRVVGSGSLNPLFTVQGSQGELFSVTDSLTGSLFSVNDISGLPILEVNSDQTVKMGNYLAPVLNATSKVTVGTTQTVLYSLPTASYDMMAYELFASSGTKRGSVTGTAVWSGSLVDVSVNNGGDFLAAANITVVGGIIGGNFAISGSAVSSGWTFKTIIRAI